MTSLADQVRAAEQRRARFLQLQQGTTPQAAANIGALARQNPSLSPGALYAAGVGGVQPGTAAARALNDGDAKVKKDDKSFLSKAWGGVYGTIKGISRGTWAAPQAFGETVQGTFREAVQDGFQFSDIGRGFSQTTLAAGHREVQREGGYRGLLTGDTDVNFGSGFFSNGDVAKDQVRAARAASPVRIGKSAVSVGRYLANELDLEPGSKAFGLVSGLADATVSLGTDPTSYVGGAVIKPLQARRLFAGDASKGFDAAGTAAGIDRRLAEQRIARFSMSAKTGQTADDLVTEMGGIRSIRDTVDSDRVLEWLTAKKEGQTLVKYLAKETDFLRVWEATKGKIDPKLIRQITARDMTGDEVIALLAPTLGKTARTDAKFGIDAVAKREVGAGGLGTIATAAFKQRTRDWRIFGVMPERVLAKNNLNATITNADAFMVNAKVSREDRSRILAKFAEVDGQEGMFEVATEMMRLGFDQAVGAGVDPEKAKKLFRIYEESESGRRAFWKEQVVGKDGTPGGWVNRAFGREDDLQKLDDGTLRAVPHLASQFLDNNVPLPDAREIRQAVSPFRNILSNPAINVPLMALEKVQESVFKPFVLLRPAFVARNQIDEQFRPAAVGMASAFSHPVQYLQWLMDDQQGVGRMLAKYSGGTFKSRGMTYADDTGATRVFDEQGDAIRKAREEYKDAQRAGDQDAIERTKAAYEAAKMARQTVTPYSDAVSEYTLARTGGAGNWRNRTFDYDNGAATFQRSDPSYSRAVGEGLHELFNDAVAKRVAADHTPEGLAKLKEDFWRGPMQGYRLKLAKEGGRMDYLNDQIGAEQYIDNTLEYIKTYTGDSPELLDAIKTGRIGGVPLVDGDTIVMSPKALAKLDELKQLPDFAGPVAAVGNNVLKGGMEDVGRWDKAVNWMFYQLSDRPVAYLSRSPVFRQRYYKRLENLVGFMEPSAAEKAIRSAEAANLRPKDVARMRAKIKPGGKLTYGEAELVAKADALEFVNDLFYSLHNRSQFFDMTRLIFPFGEAFKDSAVKYTQLVAQNPVLPYRLQQVVNGAREADLNGDGKGFFYTDEQTGEEMFGFPGSAAMLKLLPGLEGAGQLRAPVGNLNILGTSVIPGFGPVVQMSAAAVLPDTPDFNAVRAMVSPYGERTLEGGALESFFPSWLSKWKTAELLPFLDGSPAQQRSFAQAQKDMMGFLASTGEYDLQKPEDQTRLMEDAKRRAQAVFFIRGLAQAFAPSPPSPEFVAYDKDGKLQTQFKLAEEYRKIQKQQREAGTPEATNRIFIETFGEGAVLAVIPNTKAADDRSPIAPNKEAREFWQRNKEAAKRFPTVFGLFAPDDEDAKFDFVTFSQQQASGERVVVTPEEAIRRANQNVARMIYNNAKEYVGEKPTPEQRQALSDLKGKLAEDYPGYSQAFSNDTPALMEDLKRAVEDPQLSKTDPGKALKIWLDAREAAEQAAQAQYGVGWTQAAASRPIRDRMRALADKLSTDYPGFQQVFERALEREMKRD